MTAQPVDEPRAVRVQMVGDVGVGKTSLILSLISEEFFDARCLSLPPADDTAFCQMMNSSFLPGSAEQCDRLVSACEDILIPAEITITRTPCIICDLPANSSDDAIQEAIRMADVVCIVYSCTYEQSKHNIADRWIPLILGADEQGDSKSPRKPAIIVASKCDLSRDHGILTDAFIDALIEQHGWIHCRIECSALRMHNIAELFYYAQKVVLYPIDPLFDCASKRLRADFQLALRHIFHILDRRQTGRLDDDALNRLQQLAVASGYVCSDSYRGCLSDGRRCKNRPDSKLTADDFDLLKKMLTSSDDSVALLSPHDHERRLDQNEITERGFLCLFSLLLQRDLSETVWALTQVFFDGQLRFHSRDEEQLRRLEAPGGSRAGLLINVELSGDSLGFIRSLYKEHKTAQQRAFSWPSPESINEAIFKFLEPPPNHLELRYNVRHPTGDKPVNSEYVSEEQFILWWTYQVHDDPRKALLWLSQLGFDFWMTDIENGSLWCPSSFTAVQGPTVDHQHGGGSLICTVFSEPKQSSNLLLRDLAGRTMPDGDLQDWLACSLGKCQHCFGCRERALILKSPRGGRGDVNCTDWVRSSHLLILICDLADEESCQQVLNLCCTLGAPEGTEKSSALGSTSDFQRQADGQSTPVQNLFPQVLLVAINNDRCGENNVHLQTIRQMKAMCPNLWGLPLTFASKQVLSGEWADRILGHIKLCLTKCAGKTLASRALPATLSATFLSFPSSVITGTQDFLRALTTRLRSLEQPQALLDRLRFRAKDRKTIYSYYWCVVLGTSAVFGCIAVILLKHFGRRSLSSAGLTRSIFI